VSRRNDDKKITIDVPFRSEEWNQYPVGLYRKKVVNPAEAIQASFERMARLLPNIKKSTKPLVFNSGYGLAALFLADKYGCKVECICNSDETAQVTADFAKQFGLEDLINITNCLFDQVPFSGASFDLVWSMDSMSFNENKPTTLKEVARLLIPEGRFIFSDYIKSSKFLEDVWIPVESSDRQRQLVSASEYIKLADRADLERVYLREDEDQLKQHFTYVQKALEQVKDVDEQVKDRLVQLQDRLKQQQLTWGLFQFQKRND
jgi:sarcosine/dimethylglycine N-methyltransferase